MQTHQLKRIHPNMKRMTVARGGKRGKTAGRGGKGQSARAGNKRRPEWRDIIKRVPKLRGRGKNSEKSFAIKPLIVNLEILEKIFNTNDSITPTILVEKGIISTTSGVIPSVKILGDGEVTKSFKVSGCYISLSAKEKIEKVGGSIVLPIEKKTQKVVVKKVKDKKDIQKNDTQKDLVTEVIKKDVKIEEKDKEVKKAKKTKTKIKQ